MHTNIKNISTRISSFLMLFSVLLSIFTPFLTLTVVSADAEPDVAVNIATEGFLGENFSFDFHFNNPGTDTGYGPFVDIIFPYSGADGVYPFDPGFEADGISFTNATFYGAAINNRNYIFTIENGGCIEHPYAVDNTGTPIQVCGNIGDRLTVLQMPFGSFVPGQPDVNVIVNSTIHPWADVNTPLNIRVRGGYMFGATAVNDYISDPSIVDSFVNYPVSPTIISLGKQYLGPENETSTGPNFPRQYRVTANIANGQTLTSFQMRDNLPANIAYAGFGSASPVGWSVTHDLDIGNAYNTPNNNLDLEWPSISGSSGNNDASFAFNFYGPLNDANNANVISTLGGCINAVNDVSAQGYWTPIDTRDAATLVASDMTLNDRTIRLCSHTVQKSYTLQNDIAPTGITPGDTIEYTVNFQVSDYFAYDQMVLNDVISDGQRFDGSFRPTLSFSSHGQSTTDNVLLDNIEIIDHFTGGTPEVAPVDGSQEMNIYVSDELILRAFETEGRLIGGCVPTIGGAIDCTDSSSTTGTIKYRSVVQQAFSDDHAPKNANVDQGDVMNNSVSMRGRILNNSDLSATASYISEGSGASFGIVDGILSSKSIYALNGVIGTYNNPYIGPGDLLTYKITFQLPLTDIENLEIVDYLPLPVFDADDMTTFSPVVDGTVPAVGTSKFGPDDTFYAFTGINPAFSVISGSNTMHWDFGSHQTLPGSANTLDILFTIQASDQPFADGLLLTNQAYSNQDTTNNSYSTAIEINQVILTLPDVKISKGAVSSDSAAAVFDPLTTGPVSISTPPDTATCPRFSSNITSNGLATNPIGSDISNVDAGDLVTFAVVLENQGRGTNGAFDVSVKDLIPAGYTTPTGGINLCVTNGAGVAMPYSVVDGDDTLPFFEDGIRLDDTTPRDRQLIVLCW